MKRGSVFCLVSLALFAACLTAGCAASRSSGGGPDQEAATLRSSQAELLREVEGLREGNKVLQETVDRHQARILQLEEKERADQQALDDSRSRIAGLETEKSGLLEENQRLRDAAAVPSVIKEVTLVEPKKSEQAPAPAARPLRIKVLAGAGGLPAARKMSKTLHDLGYKVERMDQAAAGRFENDTVYYAKDSQKEARDLAVRIGPETIVKPLTWPSVFDVIVVAR